MFNSVKRFLRFILDEELIRNLKKIRINIVNIIGKLYIRFFNSDMSDIKFLKKAYDKTYEFSDKIGLKKYFITRNQPQTFFTDLKNKENNLLFEEDFADSRQKIIIEADKICKHIFNILGSGEIYLGEKINWHCDFKSGYCWDAGKYYKAIQNPDKGADIKIPWEFSQFRHLTMLGQAYLFTGDEKYAKEFKYQISDWIQTNPVMLGVNWASTIEVAIRVVNWLASFRYFRNSPEINEDFLLEFLKSIYQHANYIESNLEYVKVTSNHYLSNIAGLISIGVILPEFKEARRWKQWGIKELIKEIEKQVYEDGCDFEASTCYHKFALELFFFTNLLVVVNDDNFNGRNYREVSRDIFGEVYTEKLYKMFDALFYLLKPNGMLPQIGDNDSGQLFSLYTRKTLDMRYLLTLGAIFFKESKWKIKEFFNSYEDIIELLIVYGDQGKQVWDSLEWNSLDNIDSKAFLDTGWYIMREGKNYCIISCGPNGQNEKGGHCHNDKLSFELCIDARDIIVDPGTYIYTPDPEARNKFRGTAYHNAVMIDEMEQNRFDKYTLFKIKNDALTKCLTWKKDNEVDIFIGEHYGYKRFSQPVIHQREIKFYKKKKELLITDKFTGKGEHNFWWSCILSPELRSNIKIYSERLNWHEKETFYSPGYGLKVKTRKFVASSKFTFENSNYEVFSFSISLDAFY